MELENSVRKKLPAVQVEGERARVRVEVIGSGCILATPYFEDRMSVVECLN